MAETANTLAFRGTGTVSENVTSPLQRLPVELVDSILSHIGWADNDDEERKWCNRVSTLSRLSRTSKQLRQATEPALYAEFTIPLSDKALMKLLRTLTTRPSLGRHIKSIQVDFNESCARNSPTPEQMALFGPALDVFKPSSWYWSLLQAFAKGCYNANLMLLLSLATELQSLTYAYYYRHTISHESCGRCPSSGSFLADILSASRPSLLLENVFENLRTVTLQARQDFFGRYKESEVSIETLYLFSKLPLLSELRCRALIIRHQDSTTARQKQLSKLQSLILQHTSIDSASLVMLMGCCKSLKRLDVDMATYTIADETRRPIVDFGGPEMAFALERHINTLKYCALTNSQNAARIWAGKELVSQITVLKSCSILCDLTVDEDHLLGVSVDKYDEETQHANFLANRMRLWEAIDLNRIFPPRLSKLLVRSRSHFSLLKGILLGMSKYKGSELRCLEVTFPCDYDHLRNMEYKRSVESYKPYKDGAHPWLLEMVSRDASAHREKDCIRFCIVGSSLANRLHALVRTMPSEGLVPPVPLWSESEYESDPEPDHSSEDDYSGEDEWLREIAESSDNDSELDTESNDEASDTEDSWISTDEEDSAD